MVLFPAPAGPSMATTIHFCVFSAKSQDNKRRAPVRGMGYSETSTNERIDNTHVDFGRLVGQALSPRRFRLSIRAQLGQVRYCLTCLGVKRYLACFGPRQ